MAGSSGAAPTPPNRGEQEFVIDRANLPGVTRFIFLEPKGGLVSPAYATKVDAFLNLVARQQGFRAYMSLVDIDRSRLAIYYQFESEAEWNATRYSPPNALRDAVMSLVDASSRFEDIAVRPLEQGASGGGAGGGAPPGYVSRYRIGDGVATNEALVVAGRQQSELTALMRRAGVVANPATSRGFIDFTFHEAIDGSRNVNLLHWDTVSNMAAAALYTLVQPLMNAPGYAGTSDGWGAGGVGLIGVHVYHIARIQNGRP